MIKRTFDVILSLFGLMLLGWFVLLLIFLSFLDTGQNGIFKQKRIGQFGKPFHIYKIRTLKSISNVSSKATKFGRFLRRMKWDELPQLWNIFKGDMSFVGPRPDVSGYADELKREDRIILSIKPGLTGVASLFFKDEEQLLAKQEDSKTYNDQVIWPKKVQLNKAYIAEYSFYKDIIIIFKTITLSFKTK